MAIVNGPILIESYEVHADKMNDDNIVLVLTAFDGEVYGVPLARSQALHMAEKLQASAIKPR